MPQLVSKPLSWFKTNPQVRKHFDEDDLRRLGESLKAKQLQPVLCQPDGTIIAGERRFRAASLLGLASLEVKIADEQLSDGEIRIWQLVENLQRSDLSGYEKWLGCTELMSMHQNWQQKDLADHLHLSESMIVKLLSPSKCSAQWQDALKAGTVCVADCYSASRVPRSDQDELLAMKLSGANRDALEAHGRNRRNGNATIVRTSKIRCQLASGVSVVVSGQEISLDEMIEALAEAAKEAKKARDQGLDAKTFQAVMRDRSRVS